MKRLGLVAVALGLVAVALAAVWALLGPDLPWRPTAEAGAPLPEGARVLALGRIEPDPGVVVVGGTVGDRLDRLAVAEGDVVKAGQPLAYLDSHELRQLEREAVEQEQAEAQARRAAELTLAEARIASARLGIDEAATHDLAVKADESRLPVLRRRAETARRDRDRLRAVSQQVVAAQDRERQELVVQNAEAELAAAEALLAKGKRSAEIARKVAEADLAAAEAAKEVALRSIPDKSLEKKLELARAQWERAVLAAPSDGTILRVHVRAGEVLGPSPILEMADLAKMVVVAEVYERDVRKVRIGQEVLVESPALPPPADREGLRGTVVRIGRIIGRPQLDRLDPLARADRHAVEVRIELEPESSRVAAGYVNLQVDVAFSGTPEP